MSKKLFFASLSTLILLILTVCRSNESDSMTTPINKNNNKDIDIVLKDVLEYTDRMYVYEPTSNFNIGSSQTLINREAAVPEMYCTKHDGQYNPCYICHQDANKDDRANAMNDGFLKNDYTFSDFGMTNQGSNLFKDRTSEIAKISDKDIDTYVNTENYTRLKRLLESNDFLGYISRTLRIFILELIPPMKTGLPKTESGGLLLIINPFLVHFGQ